MTRNSLSIAVLLLTLLLAACRGGTSESTTEPQESSPGSDSATTVITPEGRILETVGCGDAPDSVSIVCEAYELIQRHYVDDIDDEALAAAAVMGLESLGAAMSSDPLTCALPTEEFSLSCETAAATDLDSQQAAELIVAGLAAHALDANSAYFDEQAVQLLQQEQQGEIDGIGALVSPEDETIEGDNKQCGVISETCQILIVSTIEGAPAEAAGLLRGDVIVGVNGESLDGWTVDEVTSQVRGPAGTDVVLTIDRAGDQFDVSIVRAAVVIPVIDTERFEEVGYIQLRTFSSNADEQFEEAIAGLLAEGIEDLVVDLRDNPGGLLDTAIEVTSVFLPDGDVVLTQGPDGNEAYPVTGAAIIPDDLDIVFVVNKGSASASEVVSAVLQERDRATVVGESTFGKNTVQQRFNLSNGGALKLTIARWLTPGGLDFGGVGVRPDVELELDPGLDAEALVSAVLAAA